MIPGISLKKMWTIKDSPRRGCCGQNVETRIAAWKKKTRSLAAFGDTPLLTKKLSVFLFFQNLYFCCTWLMELIPWAAWEITKTERSTVYGKGGCTGRGRCHCAVFSHTNTSIREELWLKDGDVVYCTAGPGGEGYQHPPRIASPCATIRRSPVQVSWLDYWTQASPRKTGENDNNMNLSSPLNHPDLPTLRFQRRYVE